MLLRWLGYVASVLCGFLFYLFSPGYLSFFLLVVLVLLPILSFLLTLSGYFGLSLTETIPSRQFLRDSDAAVELTLRGNRFSRLSRVKLSWQVENLLYPQTFQKGAHNFSGPSTLRFSLPCDHCGWLRFSVSHLILVDWMGLFHLRLKRPQPLLVLVRPRSEPDGLPKWDDGQIGAPLMPRPGGGPGEEYELRDYRPGDPVQNIHWKLTAKRPDGDPVLRETMEPVPVLLTVTYDHFGPPEKLDHTLEQLSALAEQLLARSQDFTIRWVHPDTEAVTLYPIDSSADWERCLHALCAQPAPVMPLAPHPAVPPVERRGNAVTLHLSWKEAEQ